MNTFTTRLKSESTPNQILHVQYTVNTGMKEATKGARWLYKPGQTDREAARGPRQQNSPSVRVAKSVIMWVLLLVPSLAINNIANVLVSVHFSPVCLYRVLCALCSV